MSRSPRARRYASRFDVDDADPMASMANLVDVMLVFACGLMAALVLGQRYLRASEGGGVDVEEVRELPELPEGRGDATGGYEAVGRVFRDPKSGKLILIQKRTP